MVLLFVLGACGGPPEAADAEPGTQRAAVTRAPATGQLPWSVFLDRDTGCTAEVLTPRWVITAAHCLYDKPGTRSVVLWLALPGGGRQAIYDGPAVYSIHPGYDHDSVRVHDIGLVHLLGTPVWLTEYALIYSDSREPWVRSYESGDQGFEVAGWGMGSDPGGQGSCDGLPYGQVKRLGTQFRLTGRNLPGTVFNGAWLPTGSPMKAMGSYTGSQQLCDGDSGSPWLLRRGGLAMQFAVHSGNRGAYLASKTATLVRPKLPWILSTAAAAGAPVDCFESSFLGYRYTSCRDR